MNVEKIAIATAKWKKEFFRDILALLEQREEIKDDDFLKILENHSSLIETITKRINLLTSRVSKLEKENQELYNALIQFIKGFEDD